MTTRKVVCTSQPQTPVGIDWGNPITKDLAFVDNAATFANAKSVSRNGFCHMAGSVEMATGQSLPYGYAGLNGLTLLSVGFINGTANVASRQFGARFGSSNTVRFGAGLSEYAGNGSIYGNVGYVDYSQTSLPVTPHSVSVNGGSLTLGLTYRRGSVGGLRGFVNGRLNASADTADKALNAGGANLLVHTADSGTNNSGYLTTLNLFFKRTLSDEEIASLSANPWQIFQKQSRPIFIPISTPGGTTIAATVGNTFAYGVPAQILGDSYVSAVPGNAILTGVTAALNRSMPALPGNALASGVSAYLNKSVISTPGNALASGVSSYLNRTFVTLPGNAIASGVTANLNFSILTTVGNALVQGVPASINISGQVVINTSPGNAIVGAPSARVDISLVTSAANVLASGVTASIGSMFTIQTTPSNAIADGILANLNLSIATLPANAIITGVTANIVTTVSTVARPSGDVSTGSWLPSSGSELYQMIDEVTPSDTDYTYATSNTTARMSLSPVGDPGTSSGQLVSYRAWSPSGNGLVVKLYQGATLIASWTHATLPPTPTTYQQALTPAECDAITDYANLILETTST